MAEKVSAFCVQWQSAIMPAPAFWYYRDPLIAQAVYDNFKEEGRSKVEPPRPCEVPATTPFGDNAWRTVGSERRAR